MATGKTAGKYTVVTVNSQVMTTMVKSITIKTDGKKIDVTTLGSGTTEHLFGLVDPEITIVCPLDNTASTGSWTVFTAAAAFASQTGVAVLIDYGIRAAAATGDPRISETLMSVSNISFSVGGPNAAPEMSVTLSPCIGNVHSFTTKP